MNDLSEAVIINLATPVKSRKVRAGFQPHWRTLFEYKCRNGHTVSVWANSFIGFKPVPGTGAITCPQCEFKARQDRGDYDLTD